MPDKLYEKYVITKRDGSPIDSEAQYFVLRLDSDGCARAAARAYADYIEPTWPGLSRDLRALISKLEQQDDRVPEETTSMQVIAADRGFHDAHVWLDGVDVSRQAVRAYVSITPNEVAHGWVELHSLDENGQPFVRDGNVVTHIARGRISWNRSKAKQPVREGGEL